MTVFIWGGRILVGFGASFMIPSVLGLIPFIYHGKNRVLAFGCIGAASGLSAFLPLFLASSCSSAASASPTACCRVLRAGARPLAQAAGHPEAR